MKLNLKIRLLRHFTGLDQQQIAAKLHISVANYSKIETGLVKADDTILENMLAIFNLGEEQYSLWPDDKSKDLIKAYMA